DGEGGALVVGEGTMIGADCLVSGAFEIGEHCLVLPGSVVSSGLPAYSVAAGNPARAILARRETPKAETSEPLLSICIPTYNRSHFLKECLRSLFAQTFDHSAVEVIVSDNASTDDTPNVVRKYAERYPIVKYVRNETNIGADR